MHKLRACNIFRVAFPATQLLAGQKKSAPFWTFEYYQTFFDVDTYQVNTPLQRKTVVWTMLYPDAEVFSSLLFSQTNLCVFTGPGQNQRFGFPSTREELCKAVYPQQSRPLR